MLKAKSHQGYDPGYSPVTSPVRFNQGSLHFCDETLFAAGQDMSLSFKDEDPQVTLYS